MNGPKTIPTSGTALILVDLQNWIVGMDWQPRAGADVVAASLRLRSAFRAAGAPVAVVRYLREDGQDGGPDADRNRLVPGLTPEPEELLVTKFGLDAFERTDLMAELGARKVTSAVIVGLSTAHGVAATARTAVGAGLSVTVAEDATASVTADEHRTALQQLSAAGAAISTVDQVLARRNRHSGRTAGR